MFQDVNAQSVLLMRVSIKVTFLVLLLEDSLFFPVWKGETAVGVVNVSGVALGRGGGSTYYQYCFLKF